MYLFVVLEKLINVGFNYIVGIIVVVVVSMWKRSLLRNGLTLYVIVVVVIVVNFMRFRIRLIMRRIVEVMS
jgi:hypothetical protein